MSKKNLVVPEARAALNQFKIEMAKELGINSNYLASYHTGRITKSLVEKGERQLLDK
ncbi:small, acid-soluble spore protein, alpha/beta type [Wukongibacter sp. M2B1]|uniref:small, acid-soluble spore protein, alpha/beta type n=1 Tax=Wukongibacter sp. M2B1 TaxID=3088895 RepID=UPI003D7970FD